MNKGKVIKSKFYSLIKRLSPRLQGLISSAMSVGALKIGAGTYIHRTVQITGKSSMYIGENTVVGGGCWFNVNYRNNEEYSIEIGSNSFIGRRNFFSSGKKIVMGSYVLTANDCHFIGSSHNIENPMVPYLLSGTTSKDVIHIGHNVFIGSGAKIVGDVHVGHGSVIGANAMVLSDVPPFSIVTGNPATIRKRYSYVRKEWLDIMNYQISDENSLPSEEDYHEHLQQAYAKIPMPYIAADAEMGNCR